MRWSSKPKFSVPLLLASVTFLSAVPSPLPAALPSALPSVEEKHISVYSPVAVYSLPILERAGREYVGLLDLLEPLGRVSTDTNPNDRGLRLRYNTIDAEFIAGKTRAKIAGRDFDFAAPFLIENSRGLIPLSSLSAFLPRFLGAPVDFRESAHRLFIGGVGIQTSFRLDASSPPRLMLNFTAPVNPTISTEPGRLRMVFKRDPVISPGSQSISFENPVITHASYSENNGDAEIEVTANEPLLASFSNDRRTIIVSAVEPASTPSGAQTNPAQPAPPTSANSSSGNTSSNLNTNSNANAHRILAVVDPAHGGDERGAALTDQLAEKDVTLGFARLLRHELEIRGFAVALLRDADTSSTLDQRAAAANLARAGIYICLHAASQGTGARVYTALLPLEGESKGVFHAWNAAQSQALPVSRIVSAAIVAEMQKKEFPVKTSYASLRPLNNVSMPAVAVELAPGAGGITDLTSANYQQRAAAAVAEAVVSVRDRLGAQP